MTDRTKTLAGLHVAVFLAGGTGLFGRFISLAGLPLVWYRVMVSVAVLTIVLACLNRLHRVPWSSILRIAACGALLALHWVAFYASIKQSNVSVGVVCIATSGFFTAFFDPLLNRKAFSWKDMLICFITIAGILLIFSLDVRYRLGIVLGLTSAGLYSLFSIFNIRVARRTSEDSSTMLLYELIGSVVFLTLCMPLFCMNSGVESIALRGSDAISLLLLGSVFTIIPFFLQLHALSRLNAFTVNVTYNLEPLYSILFAALLFGETRELSLPFWVGLALVILSVILQTFRSVRSRA